MTSEKVAVFIVSYNMGEAADALYTYIDRYAVWPTDVYLVDNASDLVPPALNTNVFIRPHNKQTTAGWLEGLKAAKKSSATFRAAPSMRREPTWAIMPPPAP